MHVRGLGLSAQACLSQMMAQITDATSSMNQLHNTRSACCQALSEHTHQMLSTTRAASTQMRERAPDGWWGARHMEGISLPQ
jgi:hypothetical protein